jgi:hypothetical protein
VKRLFALLVGVAVLGAVAYFILSRNTTEPAREDVSATIVPAPAPAASEPAPAAAPAAEPAPSAAASRPRPAAPPKPAAAAPSAAPAAPTVTLRVDADVPGAQVFIDRKFVGETPLTTTEVDPGSHALNISAKGYDSVARSITVTPGSQDVMIKFREVRLEAKLEVVHKHRIGSCTGMLIATAQGLRYETTDKDDAFTAPLLDLDAFEVDYLKKNLRVQPKKGKRYDFTDPEGNADRLFVFHRDVDKARERLKKGDAPASH